ncbi:MAG: ABC transporter ATP-binding protein [Lachnospiraceae bacterium]|nr:ABC transporter ATP-binding protein [Lachnospiraceae bacterium]
MKRNTIFQCMKKFSILVLVQIALTAVINVVTVRGNQIISNVIDNMLGGMEIAFRSFLWQFLILTAIGFVAAFLQRAAASWYGVLVCTRYKKLVAEKLYRIEYQYFDTNNSATVLNKVLGDMSEIISFLDSVLPDMLMCLVAVVIYGGYIGSLNLVLLLLLIICYPIVFKISNGFAKKVEKLSEVFRQKTDTMTEISQDAISGILVLRSFGLEEIFRGKMQKAAKELVENEEKRVTITNNAMIINRLIRWLPNILCAAYAVYLVKGGALSLGSLVAFILVLNKFVDSFIMLPFAMVDASTSFACMKRVEEILAAKEEMSGKETTPKDNQVIVKFDHVNFGYHKENPVLRNLSFQINQGENIAFVGESGGGKSTIINILCGFYEITDGKYQLYERDFEEWQLAAAREQMALVSQNVFLFPTSVEENVSYGNPDATHEEIVEACKRAEIHDFIMSLPEGYETVVGERGVLLSGGQKQRISIARAILKDAPILLLDEPTSAIDVETEQSIQRAINTISRGRTCITIAHRLSTVRDCDRIMVLNHGHIVESGTHQELMVLGGAYASMYQEVKTENE